jgi:carboxylesterase
LSGAAELAAAATIYGAARRWYPRAVERASAKRLPVGPDGIIRGAGPIDLGSDRARSGVLILHGFGDTPESISTLARALAERGYAVHAPLLAGHGRTLPEFAASAGDAWLESARAGLRALAARAPVGAIVGQSLGGALAVLLAREHGEVRTLALLAPYLDAPPSVRLIAKLAPVLGAIVPYLTTTDERSIRDPEARERALSFSATTPRLMRELVSVADRARAAFPSLEQRVLYLQSPEDNRVSPRVAEHAAASRPATTLQWVRDSGHVLTADYQRDTVATLVAGWIESA